MNLRAFMSDNVEKIEPKEVVVSHRFKDENGNPVPWKIRPITAEEDGILRDDCIKMETDPKTGKISPSFNTKDYMDRLVARHVVYPDLRSAELQDSYGVKTPEELLEKMLYSIEKSRLEEEINKLNEGITFKDLEENAKNE